MNAILKLILTLGFIAIFTSAFSQDGSFMIEFEAFSPNEKVVIEMLEANPAEPFEGIATDGSNIIYSELKGKPILLWFWDVEDEFSIGQIDGLNLMHQIYGDKIHFIGMAYDKKPFVEKALSQKQVSFPVLPYQFKLGELHYGSELGQGRLFLIDPNGIVVKAIPRSFFNNNDRAYNDLRNLLDSFSVN